MGVWGGRVAGAGPLQSPPKEHQRTRKVSTDVWASGMQVVKQGLQAANTGMGQKRVLLQTKKPPQKFMSGFATDEFWCQPRKKHLVFRIIWISEFQIWDCGPEDNHSGNALFQKKERDRPRAPLRNSQIIGSGRAPQFKPMGFNLF